MKILVLENPEEHESVTSGSRSIYPSLEMSIETEGGESELVKSLQEADLALQERRFNGVIIHHYRFTDVDYLRKKHPNMKFGAISAMIFPAEKCKPGSINECFRKILTKHYDFLLPDYDQSVWQMMRSLE